MQVVAHINDSLWLLNAIAQTGLVGLLLWRKTTRIFPAFFVYIVMTLLQSAMLFLAYRVWGFSSRVSWGISWTTQATILFARGMVIAEICRHILGRFRGIWVLARWMLLVTATLVLSYALLVSKLVWRVALVSGELGLELATASVIALVLLFARYYGVFVAPPLRALALTFFAYSCVSVLNDTLLERFLAEYVAIWNALAMCTFFVCLLVWGWALRHTVSVPAMQPLLDRSIYLQVVPEMNWRLRLLNEELMHFWSLEPDRT